MRTIAQVIDYGGQTGGSFIPAMIGLCGAAIRSGDRFVAIARIAPHSTWPAQLEEAGAELYTIDSAAQVAALLQRLRPDIVHSHFHAFDRAVLAAPRTSRIFWHVHSYRHNRSALACVKAFAQYRLLARRVEAFVPVSNTLAQECIAFGAPRGHVRPVPNGIDTNVFRQPSADERRTVRKLFGITGEAPVVLFFERTPQKGGDVVRKAMQLLPAYRLLVAGGTREQRDAFGSSPRVFGVDRIADARQLYWASDMLAFASQNEAFGFVLAEALACGLRVAASDIPVVHEIAGNVDALETFAVHDASGLARALSRLCRRTPSEAGRARIMEHFNLDHWTAAIMALYDGVPQVATAPLSGALWRQSQTPPV